MIQTEQEKKELFREHREFHKELDSFINKTKTEERERCVKALEKLKKDQDFGWATQIVVEAIDIINKLK